MQSRYPLLALSLCTTLLAGCGMGPLNTSASGRASMPGTVMGGQFPVSGATIQIYVAGNTGYGSASTALLTPAATTDANGGFNITTPYICPAGSQAYIVASGGNPGLSGTVNNSALVMMAALGPCANLSSSTHIVISEVTTVAAVWALAPFMTSYTAIGSPASNTKGLANAFAMAANLASSDRGQSPGDLPAGASVPSTTINTLANILATCVNSDGSTAANMPCAKLFAAATPSGGTAPTETTGAALLIAQHPGSPDAAWALAGSFLAFQPSLSTKPNDWTLSMMFATGGTTSKGLAMDANGNAYLVDASALRILNPSGAVTGTYTSMAGLSVALDADGYIWTGNTAGQLNRMPPTLSAPVTYTSNLVNSGSAAVIALAADGFGNAWYTCDYCSQIGKISSAGLNFGPFVAGGDFHGTAVAVDAAENAWRSDMGTSVGVVANNGTALTGSPFRCSACASPFSIAIDASGNGWLGTGTSVTRLTSAGTFTQYAYYSVGGGLNNATGVAVDGSNNIWGVSPQNISNQYPAAIGGFTNSMTAITPFLGYTGSTMAAPKYIAIDGSGNVWTGNTNNGTVTVFVGVASPTIQPLSLAVKNGTIGQKP